MFSISEHMNPNPPPPPQHTMVRVMNTDLNNRMKYEIIKYIFSNRHTAFEIALISYQGNKKSPDEFTKHCKRISDNLVRYSKEYDPTKLLCNRGYKISPVSRRFIKSRAEQKSRHGTFEYLATAKGRRIVCECAYRLKLGHNTLKWEGQYYLPRSMCSGNCDVCAMRPE